MAEKTSYTQRIDVNVLTAIDVRAKEMGLSRNEWVERCARWAIHNLPDRQYLTDPIAKQKFADSAPPEVAGNHPEDMGLDGPEGKK